MSETEPKYYTKSEVNHMLGEVEREKRELFSEYEQMQQEIDDRFNNRRRSWDHPNSFKPRYFCRA